MKYLPSGTSVKYQGSVWTVNFVNPNGTYCIYRPARLGFYYIFGARL